MPDDRLSPLRRLVARGLWDAREAQYAAWRLASDPLPSAAGELLALFASVPNDANRGTAILERARAASCYPLVHRLSLIPLEALGNEPIEAIVVTVRESLALPHGLTPDEVLEVIGPSWSGMSVGQRVAYGPRDDRKGRDTWRSTQNARVTDALRRARVAAA